MSDEIVENLKKPSAWLRVLFMAGFAVALYVAGVVLLVLMLAQIVFSLVTGSDNANLRRLGASLSEYVAQILAFLTYNSEEKPFPFAPFPLSGELSDDLGGAQQNDLQGNADAEPPAGKDPFAAAAEAAADTTVSATYRADDTVTASSPTPASEAAETESPAPKTAAKKAAVKKPAVKKTAAKKSPAAKPAAKTAASTKSTASKSATKKSTSKGAVTGSKNAGSKSND